MNPTSNLAINFTPISPAPSLGYIVEYRQVGTANYTYLSPNATTSPVNITSIVSGVAYEGYITSSCDTGFSSTPIYFNTNNYGKITFANNVRGLIFSSAQMADNSTLYYYLSGAFPIPHLNSLNAVHPVLSGVIGVSITGTPQEDNDNSIPTINLSVNGTIHQSFPYTHSGGYSFANSTFNGNDTIVISVDN